LHVDPFYGHAGEQSGSGDGGSEGSRRQIANAIVFIASDEASFITGHILNVDGGHSAN
jgi:NAD(P)-dependent dehydrogenase (short-subunit alcohol dehydrogenase family)